MSGVCGMKFEAFTDQQWDAIRSIRGDWPENVDWRKFRSALEGKGWFYWAAHQTRKAVGIPRDMFKRLRTIQGHIRKLRAGMESLPKHLRAPDLREVEQWLQESLLCYERLDEVWSSRFSGRRDAYRDSLCEIPSRRMGEYVGRRTVVLARSVWNAVRSAD
jgi:hypothetical protein